MAPLEASTESEPQVIFPDSRGDDSSTMLLCLQLTSGYGAQPGSWRVPGANLFSYTDMDQFVRYAQAAERGKIQLLFFADTPALDVDLEHEPPHFAIDPLLILTSIARETERIGLVTTSSTTFNEPYNLARQFKALDVISTAGPDGTRSPPRTQPPRQTSAARFLRVRRNTSEPTRSSKRSRRCGAAGSGTPGYATSQASGSPT